MAHLKPETLERADTSFIDANLKRRFADRLFKVEMIEEMGRELGMESPHVHLLVLVDHKSAPDKHTVIQMLGYMVRIWEHSLKIRIWLGSQLCRSRLFCLKHGRDEELVAMLRQVFRSVAGPFEGNRASTLLDTIRKYDMSVNPIVGENEVQGIFAECWPELNLPTVS